MIIENCSLRPHRSSFRPRKSIQKRQRSRIAIWDISMSYTPRFPHFPAPGYQVNGGGTLSCFRVHGLGHEKRFIEIQLPCLVGTITEMRRMSLMTLDISMYWMIVMSNSHGMAMYYQHQAKDILWLKRSWHIPKLYQFIKIPITYSLTLSLTLIIRDCLYIVYIQQ